MGNEGVKKISSSLKRKLEGYRLRPYLYTLKEVKFPKGADPYLTDGEDVCLPCGVVANLLGYKAQKSNTDEVPEAYVGMYLSVEEFYAEIFRILRFYKSPRSIARRDGFGGDTGDDSAQRGRRRARAPMRRGGALKGKSRGRVIRLKYDQNAIGLFGHALLASQVYAKYGRPFSISTTSVEAFFAELGRALMPTSRARMTEEHFAMCSFLLFFRRVAHTHARLSNYKQVQPFRKSL